MLGTEDIWVKGQAPTPTWPHWVQEEGRELFDAAVAEGTPEGLVKAFCLMRIVCGRSEASTIRAAKEGSYKEALVVGDKKYRRWMRHWLRACGNQFLFQVERKLLEEIAAPMPSKEGVEQVMAILERGFWIEQCLWVLFWAKVFGLQREDESLREVGNAMLMSIEMSDAIAPIWGLFLDPESIKTEFFLFYVRAHPRWLLDAGLGSENEE